MSASARVCGYKSCQKQSGLLVSCLRPVRQRLTSYRLRIRKHFPGCLQKPLLASMLSPMHRLSHLIFTTILLNRSYSYCHFANEGIEVGREVKYVVPGHTVSSKRGAISSPKTG